MKIGLPSVQQQAVSLRWARPDKDGLIEVPERPGLGITVCEDFLQKHSVKS